MLTARTAPLTSLRCRVYYAGGLSTARGCFRLGTKLVASSGPLQQKKSLCSTVYICKMVQVFGFPATPKARQSAYLWVKHFANIAKFSTCQPATHSCFMEPLETRARTKLVEESGQKCKFLFFDFETYVDGRMENLYPNLAVVQNDAGEQWVFPSESTQAWERCYGRNYASFCFTCGTKTIT